MASMSIMKLKKPLTLYKLRAHIVGIERFYGRSPSVERVAYVE